MSGLSRRERSARALERTGLGALLRRLGAWRGLLVLNYHRIAVGRESLYDTGLWSATPDELDAQVDFLKRRFRLVGPTDLLDGPPPGRAVMLTFDDGYRDNYELAFPILAEHGVPATFFVATGFLDQPEVPWWDRIAAMVRASRRDELRVTTWLPAAVPLDEHNRERAVAQLLAAYKALPGDTVEEFLVDLAAATGVAAPTAEPDLWMTWEMAREMRDAGMAFGGHTVSHPVLARLPEDVQRAEIEGCRLRLEEELGVAMTAFSYPVGLRDAFDDRTRAALRAAGVRLAFSFYGGFSRRSAWDNLDIRRVSVAAGERTPMVRATTALPQVFGRW